MTRIAALWGLFVVLAAADAFLVARRAVPAVRAICAWALSTALLCGFGAALGSLGERLTYDPSVTERLGPNLTGLPGLMVGTPIGVLAGALLGIALSERGLAGAWPPKRSLAVAAATLVVIGALAWWMIALTRQQAGRHVFVLLPVLGLSAVLGWLWSLREPLSSAPPAR